ncbi:hypothetical protein, partial [Rhizobium ruizarguesonis]|uniref:hypothetical protein n=1 Tax=Rhizobium ruizarguesonis TaxID=2081791 RepID=UPI001A8C06F7
RQNQPWREPIHPSSPPPKHYRQKNPIRKNKPRRKIDGFVSGLSRPEGGYLFGCGGLIAQRLVKLVEIRGYL